MSGHAGSLQKRIVLFILIGISVILLSLGVTSRSIIHKNIDGLLGKKLALSRLVRSNVDNIIKDNINRLYDISISGAVDPDDGDMLPEKEALKAAYRYSIFTDGIFLLDKGGNVLASYPERMRDAALNVLSIEPVGRMLALGKPVVSNVYTVEPTGNKVVYVLVPLRDRNGKVAGVAGGRIDPTSPLLMQKLGLIDMGAREFIDIVDSNGVVIASSRRSRTFTRCDRNKFFTTSISERKERVATCHVCHEGGKGNEKESTILAFVPLETAPWGISVQELKADVFASAADLRSRFIVLGAIFITVALILTVGISRSIVGPLRELIVGAGRIADGDLSKPVPPQGSDEIGALGRSFETMRKRLAESMARVRHHAQELEGRVEERTRQINESQKRVEELLKRNITSQEDERKRIARGLHDVTLQELSAVLMRIDLCRLRPETVSPEKIEEIRNIVVNSIDGVHSVVQNLRPSLLDDLGLVAAVKSLLHMHLDKKGVTCFVSAADVKDQRFNPRVETVLFRLMQEAIVNVARHARANHVFVGFKCDSTSIYAEIEDDGDGFDLGALYPKSPPEVRDGRGLGILGMQERVQLIGGEMEIHSQPGKGTRLLFRGPLEPKEALDAA